VARAGPPCQNWLTIAAAGQAAFLVCTQHCQHRFLTLLGYDGDFNLACFYTKNCICGISLRINDFFLAMLGDGSPSAGAFKKRRGIKGSSAPCGFWACARLHGRCRRRLTGRARYHRGLARRYRGRVFFNCDNPGTAVVFYFACEERERHVWIVGKSDSGKSTFLFNLAMGGICEGEGVAVIDPHADLAAQKSCNSHGFISTGSP
jgi:hypothetical protein